MKSAVSGRRNPALGRQRKKVINCDKETGTGESLKGSFIEKVTFELCNTYLLPKRILEGGIEVRGQRVKAL